MGILILEKAEVFPLVRDGAEIQAQRPVVPVFAVRRPRGHPAGWGQSTGTHPAGQPLGLVSIPSTPVDGGPRGELGLGKLHFHIRYRNRVSTGAAGVRLEHAGNEARVLPSSRPDRDLQIRQL